MHKTYTDCYRMQGFVGGDWSYAVNTNDTNGVLVDEVDNRWVKEEDRSLACYCLGWESIEVCMIPRPSLNDMKINLRDSLTRLPAKLQFSMRKWLNCRLGSDRAVGRGT